MGTRKPDQVKHCAHCATLLERKRFPSGVLECSTAFRRRRFCNLRCAGLARERKPEVGWMTAHYHARNLCPPGPCERCAKPDAIDVHHRDHNFRNNLRENLERLCRSCHIKEHRPRGSCAVCGAPTKGLGLCSRHYQQARRQSGAFSPSKPNG